MVKMRMDFVTNSSSTSYCIFGIEYESKVKEDANDFWTEIGKEADEIKKKGFDIHFYVEEGRGVVGMDLERMKGTETLNAFKARVTAALNKAGLNPFNQTPQFIVEEFNQNY